MKFGYNLPPAEEAKMNAVGDKLAEALNIPFDDAYSPDSQGRKRWAIAGGNKTGIGLLRTIERVLSEEVAAVSANSTAPAIIRTTLVNGEPMVVPPGSKVVKNLLSGRECIIPSDTPLCCDPSSETYHSM
jgi:hypothetical protein